MNYMNPQDAANSIKQSALDAAKCLLLAAAMITLVLLSIAQYVELVGG
jgi:hypothetical protein